MLRMRETSQSSLLYIGEVYVTKDIVRVVKSIGCGIIRGNETDKAYWLAVIDAVYSSGIIMLSELSTNKKSTLQP